MNHMTRDEAVALRTRHLQGERVDPDQVQVAIFVIARTVHEKPPRKPRSVSAYRKPGASRTPGSAQALARAVQKDLANSRLVANLRDAWIAARQLPTTIPTNQEKQPCSAQTSTN